MSERLMKAASRYMRGKSSEYLARKLLERDGWLVMRSAGSKGPFDLIALKQRGKQTLVRCVQVKRGEVSYGVELARMAQLPHSKTVELELWHYRPRRPWVIYRCITEGKWRTAALSRPATHSGALQ